MEASPCQGLCSVSAEGMSLAPPTLSRGPWACGGDAGPGYHCDGVSEGLRQKSTSLVVVVGSELFLETGGPWQGRWHSQGGGQSCLKNERMRDVPKEQTDEWWSRSQTQGDPNGEL